jgi:hypothetical protein
MKTQGLSREGENHEIGDTMVVLALKIVQAVLVIIMAILDYLEAR